MLYRTQCRIYRLLCTSNIYILKCLKHQISCHIVLIHLGFSYLTFFGRIEKNRINMLMTTRSVLLYKDNYNFYAKKEEKIETRAGLKLNFR